MRRGILLLTLVVLVGGAPQEAQDPPHIYGFHDPGGEKLILEAGLTGWVVFTEAVAGEPGTWRPGDYVPYTSKGIGALIRLNHAYHPDGTLPLEKHYDDFAKRCAKFVELSKGGSKWIIGNETNLEVEWPRVNGRIEPITAERYIDCFRKVRLAIRAVPGHENDEVIVQGTGPWNLACGDWIEYFRRILVALGDEVDGIALHTYTGEHETTLVTSDEKVKPPYDHRYKHFRAYIDFMDAIPERHRKLPVYITESNGGKGWPNGNNGWVRAAYAEIDRWNRQPGNQKIRAFCLYRWPHWDQWGIANNPEVIEDFKLALKEKYRWR